MYNECPDSRIHMPIPYKYILNVFYTSCIDISMYYKRRVRLLDSSIILILYWQ